MSEQEKDSIIRELTKQLMQWHLQYVKEKRFSSLAKARSLKEYVKLRLQFETLETLQQMGIQSFQIIDYQGFTEKICRDIFEYVISRTKYESQETLMKKIDLIFDYYEQIYAIPKGLNQEVLGLLENLIISIFTNIDILSQQYQNLKQQQKT